MDPAAPSRPATETGNAFSIAAIVCGVIAIVIFPIVFGPIGIVLGAVAKSRNERLATVALVVAVVGMLAGFALGALILANSD